jgi:hypothetical protein
MEDGNVYFESYVLMQLMVEMSGHEEILPEDIKYKILSYCDVV